MRALRFFCLLCFLSSMMGGGTAWALGKSNARSLGMGGAYTAVARNLDAVLWNPANLGLSGGRTVVLGLPSLLFGFGNNAFSSDIYEQYNGKYLTEGDKSDILDRIKDGWQFDTSFRLGVLGLSVGRFGMQHWVEFASDFAVSQAPFELLFRGTEVGKTISLDDFGGEFELLDVTAISYAHPLPYKALGLGMLGITELTAGATVKYILGGAYAKLETPEAGVVFGEYDMHASGELRIESAGIQWNLGSDKEGVDPELKPGKTGGGLALDVGAAALLGDQLTVSLGLMNVMGKVTWDTDCERAIFSFQTDTLNAVSVAEDATNGDSLYVTSDTSYAIESFESNIPAMLNIGVAYRLDVAEDGLLGIPMSPLLMKELVLAADWQQGFSSGFGVSTTPRIALGIENKMLGGVLPLRYGVAFGGTEDIAQTVGWGLYLGPFRWDMGLKNRGYWPFAGSKGFTWATRFHLAF
ncbi:MAG: DUF5723 family protein [Candidatus Latescibacterota bacterium]